MSTLRISSRDGRNVKYLSVLELSGFTKTDNYNWLSQSVPVKTRLILTCQTLFGHTLTIYFLWWLFVVTLIENIFPNKCYPAVFLVLTSKHDFAEIPWINQTVSLKSSLIISLILSYLLYQQIISREDWWSQ